MSNNDDILEILTATPGASAGHVVGWTMGGATASYRTEAVHTAAAKVGLADELRWPRVTPNQAYRRAVRSAFAGARDERRYEIVRLRDDDTFVAHAIVSREVVRAVGVEFREDVDTFTELRVGFDKRRAATKGATVAELFRTDTPRHPLLATIRAQYIDLCTRYQYGDVRNAFQRAFVAWGGVRLIDNGGVWWIPASADDLVRRWGAFIAALGSQAMILPIHHTQQAIESLRALAEQNLEGQLAALFDDLKRFASSNTTKAKTLEARVATFDALRDRAELYERLLGHNLGELKGRIAEAHDTLVASLAMRTGGTHG